MAGLGRPHFRFGGPDPWRVTRLLLCVLTALTLGGGALADAPAPAATFGAVLTPVVGLSDTLRLRIDNLATIDPAKLRLRLDDHEFADLLPQRRAANEIGFDLTGLRADKNGGWTILVGHPPLDGSKSLKVALARTDGTEVDATPGSGDKTVTLTLFGTWRIALGTAIVAFLIWMVVLLGQRTDALRDSSAPEPARPARRQYSLGRCQMAFWFVLVAAAFVMISLITGDWNAIVSAQSLTLLGISGTTAVAATIIDVTKSDAGGPAFAAQVTTHETFWSDLLQDSTGWAFHRLQILVWTLALGAISVWSAYASLSLPKFDDNLLTLMGITSGLYLGFKFPEKPS